MSNIKFRQNFKHYRNPIAFGSRQKRFAKIGYHPNLEVRPGTFKCSKLYPGSYNPKIPERVILMVPSWKRQLEIEEYSRRLGYVGDHILRERNRMKTLNGPGWQDVPELSYEKYKTFSKAPRFKEKASLDVPGPGTYGKNHIPTGWDKYRSFSILPPFEHRPKLGKGVGALRPSYYLPPNIYNPKSSIEELLLKRVSKRGPYDLFSGNRFPDKPVYDKSTTVQQRMIYSTYSSIRNEFKGKFPRCGKNSPMTSRIVLLCASMYGRNPSDPGPSDYDPYPPRAFLPSPCSFGCSLSEVRQAAKSSIIPPPGRYNLDPPKIRGNGCRSVFLSKTKRGLPKQDKFSWFE